MIYKIQIPLKLEKTLLKIPSQDRKRLIDTIDKLAENPRPNGYIKMKGNSKPDLYRIRSGDYRIIYSVMDHILLICVVEIGHRREVYK